MPLKFRSLPKIIYAVITWASKSLPVKYRSLSCGCWSFTACPGEDWPWSSLSPFKSWSVSSELLDSLVVDCWSSSVVDQLSSTILVDSFVECWLPTNDKLSPSCLENSSVDCWPSPADIDDNSPPCGLVDLPYVDCWSSTSGQPKKGSSFCAFNDSLNMASCPSAPWRLCCSSTMIHIINLKTIRQ